MNTPVLFIIFNRPQYTKQVFEVIRSVKPTKLFVAADGPRTDKEDDVRLCQEARNVINVDWECEVLTLYREKNLGCKQAVGSALTWFFKHIEEGIILEDDCLPNASFFEFTSLMLERYKNDNRVGMITGSNLLESESRDTYYFTQTTYIWGWATWRRAWNKWDVEMKQWPSLKNKGFAKEVFKDKNVAGFFSDYFDMAYDGRANTWDIQWLFASVLHKQLCIVPSKNLVTNIGVYGTHTNIRDFDGVTSYDLDCDKLPNKEKVKIDNDFEQRLLAKIRVSRWSWRRHAIKFLEVTHLKPIVRFLYHRFGVIF